MSRLFPVLCLLALPMISLAEDESDLDYRFSAHLGNQKSEFSLPIPARISVTQAAVQWTEEIGYGFLGNITVGYCEASTADLNIAGRQFGVDFGYVYKQKLFSIQAMFGFNSFSLKDDADSTLPELRWSEYAYRARLLLVPHFAVSPVIEYNKIERNGESDIGDPGNFSNFDQDLDKLVIGLRVRTDTSGEVRALALAGDYSGFMLIFSRNFY